MPKLTFRIPTGFNFKNRGIGFLEGEDWLSAGRILDDLPVKVQEEMRNRIDHWLGGGIHDKYHHGFPNDRAHDQCYVFKHQALRLYGFLCNPQPKSAAGFRLCVLTEAANKYQWNTEPGILDRAMTLLADRRSIQAIGSKYPEYLNGKGKVTWTN